MILIIQGNDHLLVQQKKKELYKKYRTDDFNFTEFSDNIEIASFIDAQQIAPMMADYYLVVARLNKRQFIRLKEYFKPTEYTVLLLILEDFVLNQDLQQGLQYDELFDCRPPHYKDTIRWIQQQAKQYGFSLDLDDRKQLALMFQNTKELSDVLYQMSLLNEFKRMEFFKELFATRQKFVWDIFIDLTLGKKKEFFTKYAAQANQNLELTRSQFNMKLIGGLLYCLGSWKDAPSWIYDKLDKLEENEEKVVPFLYSCLIELLVKARKEQSSIPILMSFTSILERVAKF